MDIINDIGARILAVEGHVSLKIIAGILIINLFVIYITVPAAIWKIAFALSEISKLLNKENRS